MLLFSSLQGTDAEKAKEAGAYLVIGAKQVSHVGGEGNIKLTKRDGVYSETIKKTEDGDEQDVEYTPEDVEYVDYIVSAQNMTQYLLPLKKVAKAKFPSTRKGIALLTRVPYIAPQYVCTGNHFIFNCGLCR